jgi:hypothetical protein
LGRVVCVKNGHLRLAVHLREPAPESGPDRAGDARMDGAKAEVLPLDARF